MAITVDKTLNTPSSKTHKLYFVTQIVLRILAIGTTLVAACLMLTNKQTTMVFGILVDAHYSYSPAFKFFAFANIVGFALSVLSLVVALVLGKNTVNPSYHYYLFLHDLIISSLLMAGLAAAMAIAYIGKYGNSHTGWMPVCDHFGKFCNRGIASFVFAVFGLIDYVILTAISAKNSNQP